MNIQGKHHLILLALTSNGCHHSWVYVDTNASGIYRIQSLFFQEKVYYLK